MPISARILLAVSLALCLIGPRFSQSPVPPDIGNHTGDVSRLEVDYRGNAEFFSAMGGTAEVE